MLHCTSLNSEKISILKSSMSPMEKSMGIQVQGLYVSYFLFSVIFFVL